MSELPALFYFRDGASGGGTAYPSSNPSNLNGDVLTIPIELGVAKAIYVESTMRSVDNLHFAQFQIAGVFCNNGGVVTAKQQSDTVVNRDNVNNKLFFTIVGTDVVIVANSGLVGATEWNSMVSIVAV